MLLPEGLSSILHGKQEVALQNLIMAQSEMQVGDLVLHFIKIKVGVLG